MNKLTHFLSAALTIFAVASCDDIFEQDIAAKTVKLISPADSAAITGSLQTFRWEPVPGASQYRIQIATPTFEASTGFALDSLTSRTEFTTALIPGAYQWRVQALNSAFTTPFTTRNVRVDSTGSLSGQQMALRAPANNSYTNRTAVTFEWHSLAAAQRYLVTLAPSPRSAAATFDTLVVANGAIGTLRLNLPVRSQLYRWKVAALNTTSLRESPTYTLTVDVTPPTAPALVGPNDGGFFTALPITLAWTRTGTDVLADSVFLYQANQTTLVSAYPRLASSGSFTLTAAGNLLAPGTYFWAVRSIDRAGNVSPLTIRRSFILQ